MAEKQTYNITWTEGARRRLERAPSFVRDMVKYRMEVFARKRGLREISEEVMDQRLARWEEEAGESFTPTLAWSAEAQDRLRRIPSPIRATVGKEIEAFALGKGMKRVDVDTVEAAKSSWQDFETFHLSMMGQPRYKDARKKETS